MSFPVASSSFRLLLPLFHSSHRSVPVKRFTAITFVSFFSSNSTKMAANVKNILITGGTDGIGREAVIYFASQPNYNVSFTGRSEEKAERLIAKCQEENNELAPPKFLKYDFSIDSEVVLFEKEVAEANNFDICVINHGVMHPNDLSTVNNRNSTMMPNLVSSYIIARKIIEERADPERNIHFVFTTSMMIILYPYRWFLSLFKIFNPKLEADWLKMCRRTRTSGWNEYMASKMGMATLASSITADDTIQNVTANCVHPGIVFTNLMSTFSRPRQSRARCLIGLIGTSLTAAGQHLVNAAKNPLVGRGRYWYRNGPNTLPSDDYSDVTILAFNNVMKKLRAEVETP